MVQFKQHIDKDVVEFCNKIIPWTEDEIESAIRYFHTAGLTVDNLVQTIENSLRHTSLPHQQIDIQKEAHEHVFWMTCVMIKHVLNYDMVDDDVPENRISGRGDFLKRGYDPVTLQEKIDSATKEQINDLKKDTTTMAFLSDNRHIE